MMDSNEHVVNEKMSRELRGEGLRMREVVHDQTPGEGLHTYFRGTDYIDGIWVSNEIEVFSAAYLLFDKYLGDHRPVAANISMNSLRGTNRPKVQPQ